MSPSKQSRAKQTRDFKADRSGVSSVEFALLAPLLFLILAFIVELSLMFISYRKFEQGVAGMTRYVLRYPEYEIRTRQNVDKIADLVMPNDWRDYLNVKVTSLQRQSGQMEELFSHVLIGQDPGLDWHEKVLPSGYVEKENVVFIAASYNYRPLFNVFNRSPFDFEVKYTILPFFSREFIWNDDRTPDKYVY